MDDIRSQRSSRRFSGRGVEQREETEMANPFRGFNYTRERRFGYFRRSMSLPAGIDTDWINPSFGYGVLEITVGDHAAIPEPQRHEAKLAAPGSPRPGSRCDRGGGLPGPPASYLPPGFHRVPRARERTRGPEHGRGRRGILRAPRGGPGERGRRRRRPCGSTEKARRCLSFIPPTTR